MKKTVLLQSDLSYVIATMGHMDTLVIADAGLPIPSETVRIDLALTKGVPGATQTLRVILEELKVEKVILAEEVKEHNPKFWVDVQELLNYYLMFLLSLCHMPISKPAQHSPARLSAQANLLLMPMSFWYRALCFR